MANRPPRTYCALTLRFTLGLFVLALLSIPLGCGKTKDSPVVVQAPTVQMEDDIKLERDENGEIIKVCVNGQELDPTKIEGSGKFLEEIKSRLKGQTPSRPLNGFLHDSSNLSKNQLTGRNPRTDGQTGGFGAGGGLGAFGGGFGGGQFGFVGGRGENAQNLGQLFQGGAGGGALGFGGGQVGMFGNRGFFDPAVPPDGRNPDMSNERYQHFHDNPFKAARNDDALSTISTAVDTASYSNVRARILEAELPTKDAVRIADFINYFPYDYAAPKNADPVAFKLELTPCPWQPKHHLLRIGLKARVIEKDKMPARNLVFLIDTSGSMQAPNRLPLVQESLKLLVEQLTSRDRVSIVSYAGEAGLRLMPTPGDDKQTILNAIAELSAGGSTNGEGGIRMAYELAQKTYLKDGIDRVILATDGDFNVGISDEAQLVRLIEDKRKSGVYLTVLGYGMGNLQDATLEKLAHHGNGHYAYIDSIDEAKKVFVEQGAALVTVAKDVKLQVEFNPAKVAAYRLIGFENRILANEDFRNDAKDAGDMGSGHACTAIYEIVPVAEKVETGEIEPLKYQTKPELTKVAQSGEWLTVRMRYKHPDTEKASEVSSILPAGGLAKESSKDLQFAAAVAAFGMILRDSEHRGVADYDKVIDWARAAKGRDPYRAEFISLAEMAKAIANKQVAMPK